MVSHAKVTRDQGGWRTKNRIADLLDQLKELGWQTSLAAREGSPADYLDTPVPGGVHVLPFAGKATGRPSDAARLLRLARRHDHVLTFMPSLLGAFATLVQPSKRAVVYAGSSWKLRGASRFRIQLEGRVARSAYAVVAHGAALQDVYARAGAYVEPAVPLVEPEVAQLLLEGLPTTDRAAGDRLRVLFVGSLSRSKGLSTLIQAVGAGSADLEVLIVGPEGDQETVAEVAAFVARTPHTSRSGYLRWNELREAYRWADALVLPSWSEGFPRVAYEATAFGAALVSTPVGGVPHLLRNGVDALLFDVGDPAALRQALARLVEDRTLSSRLSASARGRLATAFPERTAGALFDRLLLNSALSRSFPRPSTTVAVEP